MREKRYVSAEWYNSDSWFVTPLQSEETRHSQQWHHLIFWWRTLWAQKKQEHDSGQEQVLAAAFFLLPSVFLTTRLYSLISLEFVATGACPWIWRLKTWLVGCCVIELKWVQAWLMWIQWTLTLQWVKILPSSKTIIEHSLAWILGFIKIIRQN